MSTQEKILKNITDEENDQNITNILKHKKGVWKDD